MLNNAINIKKTLLKKIEKKYNYIFLNQVIMTIINLVKNGFIFMIVYVVIFNMFITIKCVLEYMLLPNIVPLIWFLVALPTPYYATMLIEPLLN
jgi:hypothetical protein